MRAMPRMQVSQRLVLLAPGSSVGQQNTSSNEKPAAQPELPPVHFANLNQPQRHQYRLNDIDGRKGFAFLDTRQVREIRVELGADEGQGKRADPRLHCRRLHADSWRQRAVRCELEIKIMERPAHE